MIRDADEYHEFLDWLDAMWNKSFEKACDKTLDADLRQRWAGAAWAFEYAVEKLEPGGN